MSISVCLQPAKLTEAFKYFIQGMGYSKLVISDRDSSVDKSLKKSRNPGSSYYLCS